MEYNFSSMSVAAITAVEKKLDKIKENVEDDISNFICVLNDKEVINRRGQLLTDVNNILSDQIRQTIIQFTASMNKVQAVLVKYL
jgi:hypothetical protein